MWVVRNENKLLCLYTIKPIREDGIWYSETNDDYNIVLPREYEKIFSELKCENEPVEVKIVEVNPIFKKICPHCGKEIRYHSDDVKTAYDCQPSSGLYDMGDDYIECPECGKCIYL